MISYIDQKYSYDALHRLTLEQQGTLTGLTIGGISWQYQWTLDQLGNWPVYKYGPALDHMFQTRTHNTVNEITAIGTGGYGWNWADPAHDAAGNMTTMPQPVQPASRDYLLTYDAWNRLISVYDDHESEFVQENEFDGLGRRIVREDVAASVTYDCYYNEEIKGVRTH